MKPADSTTTPDPLATVPAEERARIDRGARACGRTKGYDTCRACIDREVRAWHAAHPARAEGLPLFDGPPRSLYQPNGPDGSPEDCDPETLTPAEEAEIIASAPGQIGPGQTPIGDAERDPCAVREGYCGALSARAMACTRKPHTDGDHVAEGAIGEVIERWTTAAARVTEDELAEIERAAKQIRDGNWPPPGAATILLCERTSDLAAAVRALRGERDQSAHTIAALQAERESENEGARRLMARVAALESELAARPAPAVDASLEARAQLVESTLRLCGVGLLVTHPADGPRALQAVVRAVDASRPAAPEVDAEDLWADYRTERPHMTIADRVAFLAGVEAGRRTSDASRPGLTEEQAQIARAEPVIAAWLDYFAAMDRQHKSGTAADARTVRELRAKVEAMSPSVTDIVYFVALARHRARGEVGPAPAGEERPAKPCPAFFGLAGSVYGAQFGDRCDACRRTRAEHGASQ